MDARAYSSPLMMLNFLEYSFFSLLFVIIILLLNQFNRRSALDVLADLDEIVPNERQSVQCNQIKKLNNLSSNTSANYYEKFFLENRWGIPLILGLITFVIIILNGQVQIQSIPVIVVCGFSCGYLLRNYLLRSSNARRNSEIEHGLPLFMEELVMAVSSGHDIISAIKIVLSNRSSMRAGDPLMLIFSSIIKLSEGGLGFIESLKVVEKMASVPAIKHIIIHLALAYKEGGELIMPLRELADATQIMYQEKMEEKVAQLPAQATLPLVLIFAGLVIFFVTTPIIQVMQVTGSSIRINQGKK